MIVACFAAAVMVGCGNSSSEELKDAKVVTSPEVNEVEVITLERKDFASQLLSNGKLKAARRASLSFGTGGIVSVLNVSNGGRVSTGSVIAELDREEFIDKQISEDEFLFSARLEVEAVNRKYDLELPESDDYETLAGLIMFYDEDIPAEKEVVQVGKYSFTIEKKAKNRIETVSVRVLH